MKGSAFIVHNNTWSCSNEVILDMHSTPVIEGGKMVSLKQEKTLSVYGIFDVSVKAKVGDKCQFVLMDDDEGKRYGFVGSIKAVGELHTIILIDAKTEKINEILTNITFKN